MRRRVGYNNNINNNNHNASSKNTNVLEYSVYNVNIQTEEDRGRIEDMGIIYFKFVLYYLTLKKKNFLRISDLMVIHWLN